MINAYFVFRKWYWLVMIDDWLLLNNNLYVWLIFASFSTATFILLRMSFAGREMVRIIRFPALQSKFQNQLHLLYFQAVLCIMLLIHYNVVLTWLWERASVTWCIQLVKLGEVAFGGIPMIIDLLRNSHLISICNTKFWCWFLCCLKI